jgi:hypothetical protein
MIPCVSVGAFPLLFIIGLLSFTFLTSGMCLSVYLDIRKTARLSDTKHIDLPNLAAKLPSSLETLNNFDPEAMRLLQKSNPPIEQSGTQKELTTTKKRK